MSAPALPESLDHFTIVHGVVNGGEFRLEGGGKGNPHQGILRSTVHSSKELHFPVHLLNPVLILGYPTYSEYQNAAFDMFKRSNGYEYERHIKYSNGGFMKTKHIIHRDEKGLHGDFRVTSCETGEVPHLVGIEPIAETFYPGRPGVVHSKFMVFWRTDTGHLFSADVESVYRLKHEVQLPFPQFRLIEFTKVDHTQTSMDQAEVLRVVRSISQLKL